MIKFCRVLNIPHDVISFNETERVQIEVVADKLKSNNYTHVAIIHCETSSGILNPINEIGQLVYNHGSKQGFLSIHLFIQLKELFSSGSTVYIVDSMSAFGAIPISLRNGHITYIISSANKCIEGIPGFGFVICKKQHLLTCQG
jgi:2-aminoethylphosphonate-pyruvate transaminase